MNLKIKKKIEKEEEGIFGWKFFFLLLFFFCIVHNVIVVVVESDEHQSKNIKYC